MLRGLTSSLPKAGRPHVSGAARRLKLDFDKVVASLQSGDCMWSLDGRCAGPPRPTGLRHPDDPDTVLVCKAHAGRLTQLRRHPEDLNHLHAHLRAQPWQ